MSNNVVATKGNVKMFWKITVFNWNENNWSYNHWKHTHWKIRAATIDNMQVEMWTPQPNWSIDLQDLQQKQTCLFD